MAHRLRNAASVGARALSALVWSVATAPPPRAPAPVVSTGGPVPRGRAVRVLSWNVQFAGGRDLKFFYDGGRDVFVPRTTVLRTLDRIAEVVRDADADIVLLQEVDRGSARTGRIDQHLELLARVPYPSSATAPYFRNLYVPHPPHRHLGRVDMHLTVLSRFRVDQAVRWSLPALDESWVRRQFNLRRALLELELPVEGGGQLRVFDVHLSAFSRGDGTLGRQVAEVARRLEGCDQEGVSFVLGGDFNALPPGDDPYRLPDPELYADGWPIAPLFERWTSGVPADAHREAPERWRTWLPHGAAAPDRAIDHLFVSRGVQVERAQVLATAADVSDHLPVLVELTLP